MTRKIVAILSDTHAGHKLSLMNPATILWEDAIGAAEQGRAPEPYHPSLTATQRYLWDCYQEDLCELAALADDDPVMLVHNGDITQGATYPEHLVDETEAAQVEIAAWNLLPWLELPNLKALRIIHGTQSHEFGRGSAARLVVARLRSERAGLDIADMRHALFSVDGVLVDVAHHGPSPGIRNWTNGNQLRYYLRSLMLDAIAAGQEPPRVVVRGHFHEYVREWLAFTTAPPRDYEADILMVPGYTMLSHYAVQATRSASTQACGLVALEVVDGRLAGIHPFWRRLDLRTKESL
jgi:hypothetical protein